MEERSIRPQLCRATLFSCSTTMIRSYDYEVAKDALPYQGIWTYFEWYTLRSVLLWKQFNCWRPFRLMEYNQTPRISNSCCCSWCSCSSQKPSHGNISVTKRDIIDPQVSKRPEKIYETNMQKKSKNFKMSTSYKCLNSQILGLVGFFEKFKEARRPKKRPKGPKGGPKSQKRPEGPKGGPNGRGLEVGARSAPKLLVFL